MYGISNDLNNIYINARVTDQTMQKKILMNGLTFWIDTIGKKKEKRHAIREIERLLQHENSSRKILEVLVDKYKDRTSGFTRITKMGYRNGDNAPVVQIELV